MAKNNTTPDRIQTVWNRIGGDDVVDQLIAGTVKLTVEIIRRLTALTSATVAAGNQNHPDFFKTRKGLWLSDNFQNFILAAAKDEAVQAPDTTIGYADLAEAANDAEIAAELPKGHVFEDVDAFLSYLGDLIETQWGGKDGVLLNKNYRANIFYVKGLNGERFAVYVYWRGVDRRWHCYASRLDDYRWLAGFRVFSETVA